MRASCSFTPAWHWWHKFWFLAGVNSIYLQEKMIQWWQGSSSFFFFFHHTWLSSTGLHPERLLQPSCTILHSGPVGQKLIVPPQIKKISLPFPHHESLPSSTSLHHRCFYTCFLTSWAWNKNTVFLYSIQCCAVKYIKTQLLVEDVCMEQGTSDMWTNLCNWTCESTFTSLKGSYVGGLLYIFSCRDRVRR